MSQAYDGMEFLPDGTQEVGYFAVRVGDEVRIALGYDGKGEEHNRYRVYYYASLRKWRSGR